MRHVTDSVAPSPGPWQRVSHRNAPTLSLTVVDANGDEVATVRGWAGDPSPHEADARLIARAPELAEEVRVLREALRECADLLDDGVRMEQADYDSPPEPASRWDYDAYHAAGAARALLPDTGEE